MDESLLEVREYTGEGFQPLISFGTWRVAALRYLDALHPERNDTMERHLETDEVWVLLRGQGVLLLGGNGIGVGEIQSQVMEAGKVYNVKRYAWHTALLSRDALILLVENQDTGRENTEYITLSPDQCLMISGMTVQEAL